MNLSVKILLSLILSVIVGLIAGADSVPWLKTWIAPIGTMFVNLIKMMIVPVVLASLVVGVTSLGDTKKLGRIGIKVVAFYLLTTACAIVIGLGMALIVHPGTTMSLAAAEAPKIKEAPTLMQVFVNMIPSNPVQSMAKADMLPLIVFALFIGIGITYVGKKGEPLLKFFDSLAEVSYKIIGIVMELAPYGVFALLVPVVAANGPAVLLPLLSVIVVVFCACLIHAVVIYSGLVSTFAKMSPLTFFKGMSEAMMIAFTTCSSAGTLPVNMKNVQEKLGVRKEVASFVLPLGATINMDGTAIYEGVCAIFIANVYGIDLSAGQLMMIVLSGTLASIGTAGVPGAGMIMLALVLQTVGLPLEGIALVAGIDRVLDMMRTCLNITGDGAASVIINSSEKD
jgi:Na+/H+-dicarboxylate symporter